MKADKHIQELKRLSALRAYDILDTPRESDFDDIVKVASAICNTPISVINLIDEGRQWFKAEVGLGVRETPLESSICAHAILQPGLFVVPDTTQDERFQDNALVTGNPHLRFYAGALLETPEGLPLGTVCVLDYEPRDLTETQRDFLKLMASQVMKLIQLRQAVAQERAARTQSELLLRENETLMRESDHRVMNSLQLVQSVLTLQSRNASSDELKAQVDAARDRVVAIATVHQQLHLSDGLEEINVGDFLRRLVESLQQTAPPDISVEIAADDTKLPTELASPLGLLAAELLTNSFKYAYPFGAAGKVFVNFKRADNGWIFQVADEGRGLPENFSVENSTGVGMKVITALARRLNAELTYASGPSQTIFTLTCAAL